ncbi:double-strand break repair protein AddB [Emcibacter sp.]|uniref:double-strand break repair protein AddB n=1 Tax=Emcibacter sp. TaxID=1979954 RepID=UPI002AA77CBC|nr:double-strand break repair protein AddB [Emcibacter sp.]
MPRRLGKAPELYTIPPRCSFVETLARGILDRYGRDPISLSDVLVLLPNRRAVRSLREAFLRLSGEKALLLPQMQPIGDVDEDELLMASGAIPAGLEDVELPPAVSSYQRQLLLMKIIRGWYRQRGKDIPEVAQCAILAGALGQFLDQVQTERLSFDDLKDLVPADYATHWQETLDFLQILTPEWPNLLKITGYMDGAERRNRLLEGLRDQWLSAPPAHPVIAAGSTGSIPATADLLELIARLPAGCVVLPGVDVMMDEESWDVIGPTHSQYSMKALLNKIGVDRQEIDLWLAGENNEAGLPRERLLGEVMRPAETTDKWRSLDLPLDLATKGLARLDLPGAREEAGVIALIMREVLETPEKTAALVTPDRQLARRVANEMQRWGILVDDSAGTPLFNTAPGLYLRLVAWMVAEEFAPVSLLAALKHPLMSAGMETGQFRRVVRRLEKSIFRGPRPQGGLDGIDRAIGAKLAEGDSVRLQELRDWWRDVAVLMQPFAELFSKKELSFDDILVAHITLAENLAADETRSGAENLWKGDAGEAAAQLMEDLQLAAENMEDLSPEQYPALFEVFLGDVTVRPKYGQHPRLNIWGPLEARLQHADVMILAGLNEGSWPPEAAVDPWMSRPMRKDFGLPSLEQKIGLSAHDFVQACAAPHVILTRAEKVDGTPTVKSRWLARLDAIVPPDRFRDAEADKWLNWYYELDHPAETIQIDPPRPVPPLDLRPRKLSVTAIQTWMRDPYSLYAKRILRLEPLDDLDADPGAIDKGVIIHQALEDFMIRYPDTLPADPLAELLVLGKQAFEHIIDRPTVQAFWWPRFCQIADWFVETEKQRRAEGYKTLATERRGEMTFALPGGDFTLSAKADRIDARPDSTLSIIDYKTGQAATARQLHAGYAPQLPLEGLMVQNGAFEGLSGTVSDLSYWQLRGGEESPAKVTSFNEQASRTSKMDVGEVIEKSREGLLKLVTYFDLPDSAYLSNPNPAQLGYGEYDHLARTREWHGRVKEDGEDAP